MQVFYRGFNLYGQFPSAERIVDNLITYEHDKLVKWEFNHSYSVIQLDDVLSYYGAKLNSYDHFQQLNVKNIVDFCCVDDKILLRTGAGTLLKINVKDIDTIEEVPRFFGSDDKVVKISAGAKLVIAYTKKGFIYNVPEKLDFKNSNILDIQTGREHCLLLEKCGYVYTFGRGSRGQLGHGSLDDEENPRLVDALAGLRVVAIAAGGWHSGALTADGDLYIWGWNGNGQLGQVSETGEKVEAVIATPRVVDFESIDVNVIKVACGTRHTIVLLEDKKLYGCGWNKYKQLLKSDDEDLYKITYLHDFSNSNVIDIKCGPWSSSVFCDIKKDN